jgi:hypothetical protein
MKEQRLMGFSRRPLRVSKSVIEFAGFSLLLFRAGSASGQTQPIPAACNQGTECKAKITIGEGYVTGTEIIESAITVREFLRGEKAWDLVKAASPSNKFPDSGMEYIAVRIRFVFGTRADSGDLSYSIRDEQFAVVSPSGTQYQRPSIVLPKPELSGRLYLGESLEGWIVLLVSIDDKKPLMSFGNNYNRVWLKLY